MKRIWLIIGVSAVTLGGGFTAFVSSAGANGSSAQTSASSSARALVLPGKAADFALFDGPGGDTAAECRTTTHGRFSMYMSFRAIGGNALLRVTFDDSDFVNYPIPEDTSFSLQQAAGTTRGVDGILTVSEVSGVGDLVGWVSAARIPGSNGLVACFTTGT